MLCKVQHSFPDWGWSWQHRAHSDLGTRLRSSPWWLWPASQRTTVPWFQSTPQTLQTCSCLKALARAVPSAWDASPSFYSLCWFIQVLAHVSGSTSLLPLAKAPPTHTHTDTIPTLICVLWGLYQDLKLPDPFPYLFIG